MKKTGIFFLAVFAMIALAVPAFAVGEAVPHGNNTVTIMPASEWSSRIAQGDPAGAPKTKFMDVGVKVLPQYAIREGWITRLLLAGYGTNLHQDRVFVLNGEARAVDQFELGTLEAGLSQAIPTPWKQLSFGISGNYREYMKKFSQTEDFSIFGGKLSMTSFVDDMYYWSVTGSVQYQPVDCFLVYFYGGIQDMRTRGGGSVSFDGVKIYEETSSSRLEGNTVLGIGTELNFDKFMLNAAIDRTNDRDGSLRYIVGAGGHF